MRGIHADAAGRRWQRVGSFFDRPSIDHRVGVYATREFEPEVFRAQHEGFIIRAGGGQDYLIVDVVNTEIGVEITRRTPPLTVLWCRATIREARGGLSRINCCRKNDKLG